MGWEETLGLLRMETGLELRDPETLGDLKDKQTQTYYLSCL